MMLSTLDILYVTLSIFIAITGTLIAVALVKIIRILGVVEEITSYYYTFKNGLKAYEQIPAIIQQKVLEFIQKMSAKKEKKKSS